VIKVKICGITRAEDAIAAVEAGADALGFIFYPDSPRFIETEDALEIIKKLPPFVTTVGVFVDEGIDRINRFSKAAGVDAVQLHGQEPPEFCRKIERRVIKAFRVKDTEDISIIGDYDLRTCLLDTYREGTPGGTGETFDWGIAVEAKKICRIILSGGLTPGNVADAVAEVAPYAVDVGSGVESAPGIKDHDMVAEFIRNARGQS
jgi:phosphoribosylanthranilate isomerase